eukprot:gene55021-73497_t
MALLAQDPRFEVTCEAGDVGEALRCVARQRPDVILLDNHLPGVMGVDAIRGLREVAPASRVLMLTVSEDGQDLAAALRNGAQGYLLKTIEGDLLAEAIRRGEAPPLRQPADLAQHTLLEMEDGSVYEQPGRLLFSDLTVDSTTGQVTLRAEVPNPKGTLLPGLYVRVRLEQATAGNAITPAMNGELDPADAAAQMRDELNGRHASQSTNRDHDGLDPNRAVSDCLYLAVPLADGPDGRNVLPKGPVDWQGQMD